VHSRNIPQPSAGRSRGQASFSPQESQENEESETKKGICARICPTLDEALPSCGLLLRQAMERAESQHQINGMDAHDYTILE
jgi:hypothetical protein